MVQLYRYYDKNNDTDRKQEGIMAIVKPFVAVRPTEELAFRVAALPYDVYNRAEAKVETAKEPLSFLKIDRAETQMPDEVDTYDERVYAKAKELYENDENTKRIIDIARGLEGMPRNASTHACRSCYNKRSSRYLCSALYK